MLHTFRANRDRIMYTPRFSLCDLILTGVTCWLEIGRDFDTDLLTLDSQLTSSY